MPHRYLFGRDMRIRNFERLCDGLRALVGAEASRQQQGELWAMRFSVRDLDVHLLHAPEIDPQKASLVVDLGEFSPAEELDGWMELLCANHALRGAAVPRFGRDPESGRVILQYAFLLMEACAEHVYAKLLEMVSTACEWRQRQQRYTG